MKIDGGKNTYLHDFSEHSTANKDHIFPPGGQGCIKFLIRGMNLYFSGQVRIQEGRGPYGVPPPPGPDLLHFLSIHNPSPWKNTLSALFSGCREVNQEKFSTGKKIFICYHWGGKQILIYAWSPGILVEVYTTLPGGIFNPDLKLAQSLSVSLKNQSINREINQHVEKSISKSTNQSVSREINQ